MVQKGKYEYEVIIEDKRQPAYGASGIFEAKSPKDALMKALKSIETGDKLEDYKKSKVSTSRKTIYFSKENRAIITKL